MSIRFKWYIFEKIYMANIK